MSTTSSSSKSRGQSATKRLLSELRDLEAEPNPGFERIGPISDDDLFKWEAVMKGIDGTAYEGGRWHLTLTIPPTYPLLAPTITFSTPICHPNIHFRTGEICLDLLKTSWSPAYTISSTLSSVRDLLDLSADPDSPLNVDVAVLARDGDSIAVEGLVRFYAGRESCEVLHKKLWVTADPCLNQSIALAFPSVAHRLILGSDWRSRPPPKARHCSSIIITRSETRVALTSHERTTSVPDGLKRKRGGTTKFYAVHSGKKPGVYTTWEECQAQIKGHKGVQYKSFKSLTDAESFVKEGYDAAARFAQQPEKYYGVRAGFNPGIYTDWGSAQKQITGFTKPKYKSFRTQSEAQSYIDGIDNPKAEAGARSSPVPKKSKKAQATNEIDESVPPGTGPMPPISEDGFDARITLNNETRDVEYKSEEQRKAFKMQATGPSDDSVLVIYTDGSALGNGKEGSFAGVGVYFGPRDTRNVAESLKGSRQTNQRAELTALSRAIELAPKDRDIEIRTDSKYSIDCVTSWFVNWRRNGWKTASGKAVENRDLVEAVLEKIDHRKRLRSNTEFVWVKGHANEPGNVAADNLAVTAAYRAKADGLNGLNRDIGEEDVDEE